MSALKWISRVAVVATTALSLWRLWKMWRLRTVTGAEAVRTS
jgi:hypothetical protein